MDFGTPLLSKNGNERLPTLYSDFLIDRGKAQSNCFVLSEGGDGVRIFSERIPNEF